MKHFLFLILLLSGISFAANATIADCKSDFNFDVDGNTVILTDDSESETGEIFYFWTFGDGSTSTEASPEHTYAEPGVYEVCLTIETAGGCSDDRCELVAIGGEITCTAGFEFLTDGLSAFFEDGSTAAPGDVVEYLWNFGDGSTSGDANPEHAYDVEGTYEVCLTIWTSEGCTDEICYPVVIGGAIGECEADFNFITDGLAVGFTDASILDAGEVIEYNWSFGDGSTSSDASPEHVYAEAGTYNVCLIIVTSEGCIADFCQTVTVEGPGGGDCFANFDYEMDGLTFFFNSNTDPGPGDVESYQWFFGDGSTSDAENPNHTYDGAGTYNVCLVVTFATGCVVEVCNEIIIEGGDCMVTAEVIATEGLNKHFIANVSPDVEEVTYTWIFGDGETFTETTAGTASDPWHTYDEPGIYTVCVIIETGAGCVDEYCFEINVAADGGDDCDADFEWDEDGLMVNFFETADGDGYDIISYVWDFGDGTEADGPNPMHTYTEAGEYEVCLTITTAAGCTNTYCHGISVEEGGSPCAAGFVITGTELTPDGWLVVFENTSTSDGDITSTTWYFGDGTIGDSYDAEHYYTEGGSYIVCVVISTADGCTDEYCYEIVVEGAGGDECDADFEKEESGLLVEFINTSDGGGSDIVSYSWNFGDGTTSSDENPSHTYDESGSYLVCLTIVTADECVSTYCNEINVEAEGGDCEAKFDITSITEVPDGWRVEFDNNSTGTEIYRWEFGDGGISEAANPEHVYIESGVYNVCLRVGVEGTDCYDVKCEEVFVGGGDECINEASIDSTYGCVDVYEPVCGCDGVTYDNSCYAIYYGGVVFYTDGACAATTIQEETIFGSVAISPNPTKYSTTITYNLKTAGLVTIDVMDLTGKTMLQPIEHLSNPGSFEVVLNTVDLASGIYLIRLSSNGNEQIEKLVVTK